MKEEPDNKGEITKPEWLLGRTTKKLGQRRNIDGYGKRSHKKAIWQEKEEPTWTKGWRQGVARSQKYPFKATFKEIRPKEIQTF